MSGNHRLQRIRGRHQIVVAYLALFVALGGTAIAAKPLIDSAGVQDESLTGADVQNNTITGDDILESSLGKIGDADTLDGKDSTDFLGASATAANSAQLEGKTLSEVRSGIDASSLSGKTATDFLAATGKATDADKLDNRDGADYLARCDAGLVRIGDLCYERSLRDARSWASAMGGCTESGRELPSLGELYALWRAFLPDVLPGETSEQILTLDFVDDMVVKAPSMRRGLWYPGGTADTSTPLRFLCVEDPSE